MKTNNFHTYYLLLAILFLSSTVSAQSSIAPDLQNKLSTVENFVQQKSIVLDYYDSKIKESQDSSLLKSYKRSLKHWNRYFWWNENFVNSDGKIDNYNQKVLNAIEIQKREDKSNGRYQSSPWIQDGPSYNTTSKDGIGRFDVVAFHPTNANIIYAGSCNGGIFKTTNGGTSWTSLSGYLPSLGVAAICVNPSNPNIIYALSGDRNSSGFVVTYQYLSDSQGIFKSNDGGATWNVVTPFTTAAFRPRDMVMDPNDPSTLIVATSIGIFKTTNGGGAWSPVGGSATNNKNIWEIRFKPNSSDTLYATGNSKVYRSIDGGNLFSERYDIPTADRISIAVTPDNPNLVVLLAGESSNGGSDTDNMVGVFKSTNAAGTFTLFYTGTNGDLFYSYIGNNVNSGQISYNNTIAISPTNQNIILVGGLCIWKSTNGGLTWSQKTAYWPGDAGYAHPDQHYIAYNFDGKVYAANDGGIYRSLDDGNNWSFIENGLSATQFYHFEVENDEGDTWGGAQDLGLLERDDATGGFYAIATGDGYDQMTDHPWQAADGESDDTYFTLNTSIIKDCAGSFCDISLPGNTNFFGNLAMSPEAEDQIYVGYTAGLFMSVDAGDTWNMLSSSSANGCVSTCKSNADRIYFSGGSTLKKYTISTDIETSLSPSLIDSGFVSGLKITDIEVSSSNANNFYISCAGFESASKVFRSTDGGNTFHNWSFNLPNVPVFSLEVDNVGGLYAGTYLGVYYKRSNKNYWEPFYNGLPATPVTDMELYNFNVITNSYENIMISTFGRGIWKTSAYQTNCQPNLSLTGIAEGRLYKEATSNISSTQTISSSIENKIKYNAGVEISLQPGFHAKGPGEFKTYLLGCGEKVSD